MSDIITGLSGESGRPTVEEALVGPAMRSRSLVDSCRHAVRGVGHAVRTQRNMRVHITLSVIVLLLGVALRLSLLEMALLVIAIAGVLIAEMANTALEAGVDLASPELHSLARVAKDAAAGAVLLAALAAVVVGVLVIGPHLWSLLR